MIKFSDLSTAPNPNEVGNKDAFRDIHSGGKNTIDPPLFWDTFFSKRNLDTQTNPADLIPKDDEF